MLVGQPVVGPLLSEGDLDTVLHLHVVDLGKASYEEIHHYQSGIVYKIESILFMFRFFDKNAAIHLKYSTIELFIFGHKLSKLRSEHRKKE